MHLVGLLIYTLQYDARCIQRQINQIFVPAYLHIQTTQQLKHSYSSHNEYFLRCRCIRVHTNLPLRVHSFNAAVSFFHEITRGEAPFDFYQFPVFSFKISFFGFREAANLLTPYSFKIHAFRDVTPCRWLNGLERQQWFHIQRSRSRCLWKLKAWRIFETSLSNPSAQCRTHQTWIHMFLQVECIALLINGYYQLYC